jgi:tetratricopeptide (TPR) repeat protein
MTSDDVGNNQASAQTSTDDDAEYATIAISLDDADVAKVEAAEKWSRAALRLADEDLDSLWFERLGSTYASLDEYPAAVEAFSQAKLRPSPSWNVFDGLATSLSEQLDLRGACAALELALEGQSPEAAIDVDTKQRAKAYGRLADWHYELREPDAAIQFSKKAHDLCPDDALHQYNLLKYYVLFGRDDEASPLVVEAARMAGIFAATGHQMSRLGLILRHFASAERFARYPPLYVFGRILVLVAEADCISILLDDIKAAIDCAREEKEHYERSALLICQGIAQFHHHQLAAAQGGGGSDDSADQHLREALSSWRESCVVAQNNPYEHSSWFAAEICDLATWLAGWHLFDELRKLMGCGPTVNLAAAIHTAHDTEQQQTNNALKESATGTKKNADQLDGEIRTRVDELESLVLQYKQPGRISPMQCYLASYYAVHGQVPKARAVFTSDMATVLAMLSDGDQGNNEVAFGMMIPILRHTGDDVNALAALLLTPRDLPRQHLKDVLAEVLAGPEGTQTDIEKEVVEEMLGLLETDDLKDELDTDQAVAQLISKVKELYSTEAKMQQQEVKASDEDGGQELQEKPEDTVDEVKKEKEKTLRVQAYKAATEILERFATVLGRRWSYRCDGCYTKHWDFNNAMHACRFCYDTAFCQTCLEALQAPGGHRGRNARQICGPDHEWLTLPRWDAKRWAETFAKTVRVPRTRVHDGSVDAQSTEGDYDVVSASSWLRTIVDDWGLKQEDWDF